MDFMGSHVDLLFNLLAVSIVVFAFYLLFVLDIYQRRTQKKLWRLILLGVCVGIFPVGSIALLLVKYIWLSATISEEIAKFLGILFVARILSPKLTQTDKFDITRWGIGLGFFLETSAYMFEGAWFQVTVTRLLVVVPFHAISAMLISFGFAEKKRNLQTFLLLLAAVLHMWFNSVVYNVLLRKQCLEPC